MNDVQTKREIFFKKALNFFESAGIYAEIGDFKTSASFILKALDQERRASDIGPQVLQLIKPRS